MSKKPPLDPESLNKISNPDFWQALRPASEQLKHSITDGMAGRNAKAFRGLAAWHRQTLSPFRDVMEERIGGTSRASRKTMRDLLNNRINLWHNVIVGFGPRIDWGFRHLAKPLHGFYYIYWMIPAVKAWINEGSTPAREWIEKTVTEYQQSLTGKIHPNTNPLPDISVMHNCLAGQGKVRVLMPAYMALVRDGQSNPATVAAFMKVLLGVGRAMHAILTWEAAQKTPHTNNISIAGAGTLSILAGLFPEFRESNAWRRRSEERFLFFAKHSFYSDGGYGERVWGYGCGALSHLVDAYLTAGRLGGLGVAEEPLRKALHRCFRWYAKTLGPNERQPTFGDAEPSPRKNPTALDLAARMFPNARDRFLGVDRQKSYLLKPSGFAVMRNGDDAGSMYINVAFGRYTSWHSHWEQLSMNLWAHDTPLIQELDRWGPYHNPLDIMVRAPEAHNLFLVDGMVFDPRLSNAHDIQWYSDTHVDYFSACHRGYRYGAFANRSPGIFNMDGVVRRTLVFVKNPGYVLVMDSVYDENHPGFNRAVSQYWHSPFPFKQETPNRVRTVNPDSPNCILAFARSEGLRRLQCTVDFAGDEVEHQGPLKDRYSLRACRWGRVEEPGMPGFTTLLFPCNTSRTPPVSVCPLPTSGGAAYRAEGYEVITPAGRDLILLNPEQRPGIRCAGKSILSPGIFVLDHGRGSVKIPPSKGS